MSKREVQDLLEKLPMGADDPDSVNEVRTHKGDFMSPATRSSVMSRIKGKGTKPELILSLLLDKLFIPYETHSSDLPGKPDFVFRTHRLVVFVDGDFWHGYRFDEWRLKLSEKWENKIAGNIRRDRKNRRLLRAMGWSVISIWEHRIKKDPVACSNRVSRALTKLEFHQRSLPD